MNTGASRGIDAQSLAPISDHLAVAALLLLVLDFLAAAAVAALDRNRYLKSHSSDPY
jgi:hypothetical protein